MLKIIILGDEWFDEETETFETVGDFELELEHSLISLSKWESKFQRPFLDKDDRTPEEIFSYVKDMIITEDYPSTILNRLSQKNVNEITAYVESKESATTFGNSPDQKVRTEVITSELIYYWMVAFNIPFECEQWHLNRLFALIRICTIKNAPDKKMSRQEVARRNRDLNTARRAKYNTSG